MAQPAKLYYINIIDIGTENDVEIRRYPLFDPVMVESNGQPWPIIEKEVVSVKSLFKRLLPQKDQPARDWEGQSTDPETSEEPVDQRPRAERSRTGDRGTADEQLQVHIEFFLYDSKSQGKSIYSETDIHRYPMMGFTLYFDHPGERNARPMWINWVLKGLEQTLAGMKVIPHLVDEPDLYSLFVDLKRYPHPEVKKCIYLVFQQMYQWQNLGNDDVALRIHIGGDELYQRLLDTYSQAV
ncbi:MAG: hypothetical protein ACOYEF_03690 [Planifilum sp.]|jgi:hypothetical protein